VVTLDFLSESSLTSRLVLCPTYFPIHQALLRNNKLYVAFIFTGALVGERLVHNTTGALWEMNNQGVSRRPHPGPAPADPSLLTTELCISLSLSLSICTLRALEQKLYKHLEGTVIGGASDEDDE